MRDLFERLSGRREYRFASILLITVGALFLALPLATELKRTWGYLIVGIVLALYLGLAVITYFRLRNASLSSWWLLPLIIVFPIGPTWEIGSWEWGSIRFAPSEFVTLVPIIIGWLARGGGPRSPGSNRQN